MASATLSIPVPPPQVTGASVDVSGLVGPKTVQLSGSFAGTYSLLASHDGVEYAPLAAISSGQGSIVLGPESYRYLRLRSDASPEGVNTCQVTAEQAGAGDNHFSVIATFPAGIVGESTPVDTYALFPPTGLARYVSFICAGRFVGSVAVLGSLDGSSYSALGSFRIDQIDSSRPAPVDPEAIELGPLPSDEKFRYLKVSVQGLVSGPVVVSVGGNTPTASTSPQTLTVDTMADLRALAAPSATGPSVLLLGYYSPGDGGGGLFLWNPVVTMADDEGLVIGPDVPPIAGRWMRVWDGWDWTANLTPPSIGRVSVRWFGAVHEGAVDDHPRVQQAMRACGMHGSSVNLEFPYGKYLVNSPLKLPSHTRIFTIRGPDQSTMLNGSGASLWCRDVIGLLLPLVDALEGGTVDNLDHVGIDSVVLDGSNEGNTASTTCDGFLGGYLTGSSPNWHGLTGLVVRRTNCYYLAKLGAIALDLSHTVFITVEESSVVGIVNGYAIYTSSPNLISTTTTLRKVYLSTNLECLYLGSNTQQIDIEEVVFEASLIAVFSLSSLHSFRDCWFEFMGFAPGTRHTSLSTKPGTADPLDTAIYLKCSTATFDTCLFAYQYNLSTLSAWCECDGHPYAPYITKGYASFKACSLLSLDKPFFSASSSLAARGDFTIEVDDTRYGLAPALPPYIPQTLIANYADARCVTRGRINVDLDSGDNVPVRVENGLFEYGYSPDDAYAGPQASWPSGGQNLRGDRVRINAPVAGGWSGYTCVADGTAGTWKGYGQVDA